MTELCQSLVTWRQRPMIFAAPRPFKTLPERGFVNRTWMSDGICMPYAIAIAKLSTTEQNEIEKWWTGVFQNVIT